MRIPFRRHPWLAGGTAVVIVAGTGLGIYFGTRTTSVAAKATTTTQTVSTGTIRQSVSATGALAPAEEESLEFGVSGTVTHVYAAVGKKVTKGQALATVDSASLASTVAQAQASVASAQAKVDDDATNGATDTQTNADEASLKAAKNQLASAKAQLTSATLTSPIDGVVAEVNLSVGQSLSGSGSGSNSGSGAAGGADAAGGGSNASSSSSSTAQVLVISRDTWIVNATVDATSVGLIKAGNQAQLTVDGASQTLYGTIASIGLVSSSSSGTASYPVVVDVTGTQSGLHDGASVTATLIYKQLSDVLVVPAAALHRTSGSSYVEKLVNGKTVKATVETGLTSGGQVQVTSGLAAGDTIVVPQTVLGRLRGSNGNNGGTQTGRFPGGNFPGGGNFPAGANFPAGGFGGGGAGGN